MSYKILIVDDSSVTRAVLKKTIAMTGIDIEVFYEASNGKEGLEVLDNNQVDLVMADLNMPVMNGLEMTDKIFANEKTHDIPVVVISTEASSSRIDTLEEKGVRGYVHKPFTPESIRNVLTSVLEKSSVQS